LLILSACGIQPSFWTRNPTASVYPTGGEIDILEGVNTQINDHYSYRTSNNCTVIGATENGWVETTNCYINAPGQTAGQGCGGWSLDGTSFGTGANTQGGGVYALDWRPEGIRTWFFPRNAIPADIVSGKPTTKNWGTVFSPLFIQPNLFSQCLIFQMLVVISHPISLITRLSLTLRITRNLPSVTIVFVGTELPQSIHLGAVQEHVKTKSQLSQRRFLKHTLEFKV
jgi:hypothetical protein